MPYFRFPSNCHKSTLFPDIALASMVFPISLMILYVHSTLHVQTKTGDRMTINIYLFIYFFAIVSLRFGITLRANTVLLFFFHFYLLTFYSKMLYKNTKRSDFLLCYNFITRIINSTQQCFLGEYDMEEISFTSHWVNISFRFCVHIPYERNERVESPFIHFLPFCSLVCFHVCLSIFCLVFIFT